MIAKAYQAIGIKIILTFSLVPAACTVSKPSTVSGSQTVSEAPKAQEGPRIVNDDLLAWEDLSLDCEEIKAVSAQIPTHRYSLTVLDLPLDWNVPNGEKTKVAFHVFDPVAPVKEVTPPIIEFTGGPGANAGISIRNAFAEMVFAGYGKNRKLIFFDQRGTAGCSDPFSLAIGENPSETRRYSALFASESIILDVEAFRKSHGIDSWILSGTSHGSLLAHRYLAMLGDITAKGAPNPIAKIHAQVDPVNESWRDRAALSALHQYRKAQIEAKADAEVYKDPLYQQMAASLDEEDCVNGVCGAELRKLLIPFRKWLSETEIAEMNAAYSSSSAQGKITFLGVFANYVPAASGSVVSYDPCDISHISAEQTLQEESKTSIGHCFNSAVNSFDTLDSLDQNLTQNDHCQTLSELELTGDSRVAFQAMCPEISPKFSSPQVYFGPSKPLRLDLMRANLERFQIPLTLVIGFQDPISPPETYLHELRAYGFDAEAVISHCYQANAPTPGIWERGLVKVVEHCDQGHEALYPVLSYPIGP